MLLLLLLLLAIPVAYTAADCSNVRSLSRLSLDNLYGMWFGVGYVQHLPDWSDVPSRVGCVVLHISDVTREPPPDWLGDDTLIRRNWTDASWRSPKSNPWSDTPLAGSWLDVPFKHIFKRDHASEPASVELEEGRPGLGRTRRQRPSETGRVRVLWDEDGHSQERTYVYHVTVPGAWTREGRGERERDMDDAPSRPEYINVLHSTPHMLILNYCSARGLGRHFSLVLRRSAVALEPWNWQAVKRTLVRYRAPHVHRQAAVCAGRAPLVSALGVAAGVWLCWRSSLMDTSA